MTGSGLVLWKHGEDRERRRKWGTPRRRETREVPCPPPPRRLTSEGRGAWGAEADVQTAPPGTTAPRRRVHPGPGPTLTWIPSRPALSTTRSFHFRVIRFDRTGPKKKKKSILTYALNAESEDPGVTMERDAQHSWPHPQERGSPRPQDICKTWGRGRF